MTTENCLSCDKHKYNAALGDFCITTKDHIEAPFPPPCSDYAPNGEYEDYDGFIKGEQ